MYVQVDSLAEVLYLPVGGLAEQALVVTGGSRDADVTADQLAASYNSLYVQTLVSLGERGKGGVLRLC
jgi:hypothetical protein